MGLVLGSPLGGCCVGPTWAAVLRSPWGSYPNGPTTTWGLPLSCSGMFIPCWPPQRAFGAVSTPLPRSTGSAFQPPHHPVLLKKRLSFPGEVQWNSPCASSPAASPWLLSWCWLFCSLLLLFLKENPREEAQPPPKCQHQAPGKETSPALLTRAVCSPWEASETFVSSLPAPPPSVPTAPSGPSGEGREKKALDQQSTLCKSI